MTTAMEARHLGFESCLQATSATDLLSIRCPPSASVFSTVKRGKENSWWVSAWGLTVAGRASCGRFSSQFPQEQSRGGDSGANDSRRAWGRQHRSSRASSGVGRGPGSPGSCPWVALLQQRSSLACPSPDPSSQGHWGGRGLQATWPLGQAPRDQTCVLGRLRVQHLGPGPHPSRGQLCIGGTWMAW